MWPLLLHHLSLVELALGFVIMNCRPRQIALLLAVLVGLIGRDDQRSRAERAIAIVKALTDDRRRKRRVLPPAPPP